MDENGLGQDHVPLTDAENLTIKGILVVCVVVLLWVLFF